MKTLFITISALFLTLASCNNNVVISENRKVESEIWEIDEDIEFKAEITDINKFCNFYIEININEDFLTNNLWLFIRTQSPSGNTQNDTLQYYIADETGKWYGTKSGKIIKNKFLYKSNIRFPEKGIYTFNLMHGMREKDLPKISEIGIKIDLTNNDNDF
ncbi:MAG: gliding motility lipoprotein GldH [Bacteroidales bacterium]|nr:gliding motility lipoprotein GldH [Bacteroidales bacterium]